MDADELIQRAVISDLLDDYADGIDRRDFEQVAGLFAPDARLDYSSSGAPVGTRDEVIAWLQTSLGAVALTQHLLTNRRIRIDGDAATATTELFNPLLFDADGSTQLLLLGGRYEDRLQRTGEGWQIIDRVHTTTWTAGPWPAQLSIPEG